MTRRGHVRYECIGVHRCGQRLTDIAAHWCRYCAGGAYCGDAIVGHEQAHKTLGRSDCMHRLQKLAEKARPYRYACRSCGKLLKIASGVLI